MFVSSPSLWLKSSEGIQLESSAFLKFLADVSVEKLSRMDKETATVMKES